MKEEEPAARSQPVVDDIALQDSSGVSTKQSGYPLSNIFPQGALYGRHSEQLQLKQAYERVKNGNTKSEFVLLQGPTGVGKTAIARSLSQLVLADGGCFCRGSFDKFLQRQPHGAFAELLGEFAEAVVDQGRADAVADSIRAGIGAPGRRILSSLIPEFDKILGCPVEHEDGHHELSGSEAANRFKYVFCRFLKSISSRDRPLVFLLDDLHWADESALELVEPVLTESVVEGILFVATSRETTTVCNPRFVRTLELLETSSRTTVTNISVHPLTETEVGDLLVNALSSDARKVKPLASWAIMQSRGNVFFLVEAIRALVESEVLRCDSPGEWFWDNDEVGLEVKAVYDLIVSRIERLSDKAREMLELASCLGSKVDEDVLERLSGEAVAGYLLEAADLDLLVYNGSRREWHFCHDLVQEVTYGLIEDVERAAFHYRIGRRLWKSFDLADLDDAIFVVVGQLMMGDEISDARERTAVAKLCLRAGERAAEMSSFQTSYQYFQHGIQLLGQRPWRDNYDVCLSLHNAAAEVAFAAGKCDQVFCLVGDILENSRNFDDKFRAHSINIYAKGSTGQIEAAVDSGLTILKQLGEELPSNPRCRLARSEVMKISRRLRGKTDEALLRLPLMQDTGKLAAMQILNLLVPYVYMSRPQLLPFLGCKMMSLTLDYGISAVSSLGVIVYASLLSVPGFGDVDDGFRYGKVGLALYQKFNQKAYFARVIALYHKCIHPWKRPSSESTESLLQASMVGLVSGDILFGHLSMGFLWHIKFEQSSLQSLESEIYEAQERMEYIGKGVVLLMAKPLRLVMRKLMGVHKGSIADFVRDMKIQDEKMLQDIETSKNWRAHNIALLCYLLGDLEEAETHVPLSHKLIKQPFGAISTSQIMLFNSLICIALARKRGQRRAAVARSHGSMLLKWAQDCPQNFMGKALLIDAELASLSGDDRGAYPKFVTAIAMSKDAGFLMDTAIANELTGKHLLRVGEVELARSFLQEALAKYTDWGATAKVEHLEEELKGQMDCSGGVALCGLPSARVASGGHSNNA